MAMELNGSFSDYPVMKQDYSSYGTQGMAGSSAAGTKKRETEKVSEAEGKNKSKSTADYARELAKLVPSVEFKVGNTFATAKSGKTLTVSPKLLEEMQNNPEKEKEMKELIRGVESAVNMLDSMCKASGWTVVFKHSYIDENGQYRSIAYLRNDFMLNMSEKLREERRENAEKLLERQKEKAAENKEELEEKSEKKLEEKQTAETDEEESEKTLTDKAKRLISEKIAGSKDGMIYLYDTDIRTIIEAAKEENAGKGGIKEQMPAGTNLDLKI